MSAPLELSVEQRAAMTGAVARIAPATGEDVRRALSDSWSVTGRVEARVPAIVRRLLDAEAEVERLRTERHETNEALDDAVAAVREKDALIAELQTKLAAREAHAGRLATCLVDRTTELLNAEAVPAPIRTPVPADSFAARLARVLSRQYADVVTAQPVDELTLNLSVEPADMARWEWWRTRVHAGPSTFRGSYATAHGNFGRTKVLLTGVGVGVLYAADRDQVGGVL